MSQINCKNLSCFLFIFFFIALLTIPASADNSDSSFFSLRITANQAFTDVWVLTGVLTEGSINGTVTQVFIGNVPSGINDYKFYVSGTPNVYTVMGLYDSVNNGVTVAMQNVPYGISWDNYFHPEYFTDWIDATEASVASHLKVLDTDRPYWLEDFYCNYQIASQYGFGGIGGPEALALVNFSDATLGGSTYGSVVRTPEPATMFLLCLGLLGLAGIRRKFQQ